MKTIIALLSLAVALVTVPASADCTGPNCGAPINNGPRESGKGPCRPVVVNGKSYCI